jgi:uncharacterized membrane protein
VIRSSPVCSPPTFRPALILIWEGLLGRIPVVKSIYSSVKQVSDTVLSDQGTAFRKALLVEFPRPGCWTIAFLTGAPAEAVVDHLPGDHISIYVPTTPNPTGGYFVMVPRNSVREDMSVDEHSSTSYRWAWFPLAPPSCSDRGARCAACRRACRN